MADDSTLSYSDLLKPDNAIEQAVAQLEALGDEYKALTDQVRKNAEEIRRVLSTASGATKTSREQIEQAVVAANLLYEAYKSLEAQQTTLGKTQEYFSAKMRENKKDMASAYKEANAAAGSYNKLRAQLQEYIDLYKSLSTTERLDPNFGGQMLTDILNLKKELQGIDDELKLIRETASAPAPASGSYDELKQTLKSLKAEWQAMSESERDSTIRGQLTADAIKDTEAQLKKLDEQLKTTITTQDKLNNARTKYNDLLAKSEDIVPDQSKNIEAITDETEKLSLYNEKIKERQRIVELQNRVNASEVGSYNRLAAQYELNRIKLNAMSAEQRKAKDVGVALEQETQKLYERMKLLQEAIGNHRLSVGDYKKAWTGLGFAVSQVVRELPSLAINWNTFFLAISNNVPIVIDEIKKLKRENEALLAQGKKTKSVTKEIVGALISWQTVLILLVTALSKYGTEIMDWLDYIWSGIDKIADRGEVLRGITKELTETGNGYGKTLVKYKELQYEWNRLDGLKAQNDWLRTNAEAFKELDINCSNAKDAEDIFVTNSDTVVKALTLRAKAAAAAAFAQQKYQEALAEQFKAETLNNDMSGFMDAAEATFRAIPLYFKGASEDTKQALFESKLEQWKRDNIGYTGEQLMAAQMAIAEAVEKYAEKIKGSWAKSLIFAYEAGPRKRHLDTANLRNKEAEEALNDQYNWLKQVDELLESINKKRYIKKDRNGREPRDLTHTINQNDITIQRKYEESITKLTNDEYAKRRQAAENQIADENRKLRKMFLMNEEYILNIEGKYKELTGDQKKQIEQQQRWINDTIDNNEKILATQLKRYKAEQLAGAEQVQRQGLNESYISIFDTYKPVVTTSLDITQNTKALEDSIQRERELREEALDLEYDLILATNKKLREAGDAEAKSEEEILVELQKKKYELYSKYDQEILNLRAKNIENQLALVEKGTEEELNLILAQNEINRQLALVQNAAKPASQQVSTSVINAQFDKSAGLAKGQFQMTQFEQQQATELARFNLVKHTEGQITKKKLEQERDRWQKQIELAKSGGLEWSKEQIKAAELTVQGINREISELDNIFDKIGKKGLGYTLLESLGFDDDAIEAITKATNIILENIQEILNAEVELAEKQVELAEKRVDAAQKAYDAEVEARNNGYANNVATAKKELEQEKKRQLEKQKIFEAAQRRQEALNTAMQASNLVSASALIWAQLGFPWAIPAITAMWTSFAVAKIKAKQVTAAASEEYGDGGLEFLEGGSHASGNDIDLQTTNRKGKRMRAEGGEAMAIINKRQTKRYKKLLPDIVDSLNKGTFEDKYSNAFSGADRIVMALNASNNIDLTKIEKSIDDIRKQNSIRSYIMPDGSTVIIHKNVKRIIKK